MGICITILMQHRSVYPKKKTEKLHIRMYSEEKKREKKQNLQTKLYSTNMAETQRVMLASEWKQNSSEIIVFQFALFGWFHLWNEWLNYILILPFRWPNPSYAKGKLISLTHFNSELSRKFYCSTNDDSGSRNSVWIRIFWWFWSIWSRVSMTRFNEILVKIV